LSSSGSTPREKSTFCFCDHPAAAIPSMKPLNHSSENYASSEDPVLIGVSSHCTGEGPHCDSRRIAGLGFHLSLCFPWRYLFTLDRLRMAAPATRKGNLALPDSMHHLCLYFRRQDRHFARTMSSLRQLKREI